MFRWCFTLINTILSVTLIRVGQGSEPGRYSSDGDANDKRSVARVRRPTLLYGTSVVCRMALALGSRSPSDGVGLMSMATGWQVIQGEEI